LLECLYDRFNTKKAGCVGIVGYISGSVFIT
jgi:hypothetical protein